MFSSAFALGLLALIGVNALPTSLERRGTVLTPSQLSAIVPFAQFSRVAYCPTSKIQGWKCGQACKALSGFNPTLIGGDGNNVQNFFVGFWPQENTIVVGHEGTDPTQLKSDLTDAKFGKAALSSTLFPGASSKMQVHQGFRDAHALTADAIFVEVRKLLTNTGASHVTTVGHSLGAAISVLDALSLSLRLPSSVGISVRTFGCPRVGDPNFVSFFESKVSDIQRVNYKQDLIPTLPGRFLGYEHPQGEIHILSAGNAVACAGDDNGSDPQCTDSTVPNILKGNILDHLGPYQGVGIGTIFCY